MTNNKEPKKMSRCPYCDSVVKEKLKTGIYAELDVVVKEICQEYYINPKLMHRSRLRQAIRIKHSIMSALLLQGFESTEIGRLFDVDHSTVLHAAQAINNSIITEPYTEKVFKDIQLQVNEKLIRKDRKDGSEIAKC